MTTSRSRTHVLELRAVSHKVFMYMVRMTLPKAVTHDDLQEFCKRALVLDKNRNYISMPSASMEAKVETVEYWPPISNPDLLTKEGNCQTQDLVTR